MTGPVQGRVEGVVVGLSSHLLSFSASTVCGQVQTHSFIVGGEGDGGAGGCDLVVSSIAKGDHGGVEGGEGDERNEGEDPNSQGKDSVGHQEEDAHEEPHARRGGGGGRWKVVFLQRVEVHLKEELFEGVAAITWWAAFIRPALEATLVPRFVAQTEGGITGKPDMRGEGGDGKGRKEGEGGYQRLRRWATTQRGGTAVTAAAAHDDGHHSIALYHSHMTYHRSGP